MSDEMPDWLADLVSTSEDEGDDQPLVASVRPQAIVEQPQVAILQPEIEAIPEVVLETEEEMMDSLRSQVAQADVVPPPPVKRSARLVLGMLPWQVFFLSVLMFLNVLVIGMLFLLIFGRVVLF